MLVAMVLVVVLVVLVVLLMVLLLLLRPRLIFSATATTGSSSTCGLGGRWRYGDYLRIPAVHS